MLVALATVVASLPLGPARAGPGALTGASSPGPVTLGQAGAAGISRDEDARLLPGPPEPVQVIRRDGRFLIRWRGTRLDILVGYRIYQRCGAAAWQPMTDVPIQPPNDGIYEWSGRSPAEACEFAVAALDHYGHEGPRSAAVLLPQRPP